MKNKRKGFICRNCGDRVLTNHNIRKSKCKKCGDLVCDKCKVNDSCINCYVKNTKSELLNINDCLDTLKDKKEYVTRC